jgi:hypothetical protein
MSGQQFARLSAAGPVLLLACGCGAKSGLDSIVHPGSDAADAAITPDAAVGDAADSAPTLDAASLAQDAAPACTTDEISLVVSESQQFGPYSIEAFHPASGQLTNLGPLVCSPYINGLAVDRSGRFYVAAGETSVFPVDTTAGFACALPGFISSDFYPQGGGFQPLGIAFVGRSTPFRGPSTTSSADIPSTPAPSTPAH